MTTIAYTAVTPVRDELGCLPRLLGALEGQSIPPAAWVVVDTGSTDGSLEIVREWMRDRPWITLATLPVAERRRGAVVAHAIETGLEHLPCETDVIAVVDADVSFGPRRGERND